MAKDSVSSFIISLLIAVLVCVGAGFEFKDFIVGVFRSKDFSAKMIAWEVTFGQGATVKDLQLTGDNAYLATGITDASGAVGSDAWVKKLTSTGQTVWEQTIHRKQFDIPRAIHPTPDGGAILVGEISRTNNTDQEGWIVKFTSSGSIQWERTLARTQFDIWHPADITPILDEGYVIVGETYSRNREKSDAWILKLDASGNTLWEHFLGGDGNDQFTAVSALPDASYLVVGHTDYTGWILKLDAQGGQIWEQKVGGNKADILTDIAPISDNQYIATGRTRSQGNGDFDVWVVKFDTTGQILWQYTFGDRDWNQGESVAPTPDGGYIVAGSKSAGRDGDGWVLKLDAQGHLQWDRSIGDTTLDYTFNAVQPAVHGGYVVAGNKGEKAWIVQLKSE